MERLELPLLAQQVPKTCVSTNSTTWANGAATRTRTADLRFTKPLLYQLSYSSLSQEYLYVNITQQEYFLDLVSVIL